jgi:hypothetical protein
MFFARQHLMPMLLPPAIDEAKLLNPGRLAQKYQ